VLWPSASTVAVAGVRVSVMPWNVTFVWALVPAPYVAVTVAVWSVLVGLDVRVTVAWPLAFVVAVVVDSVPIVLVKLMVAPLTGDPALVSVAVIVVVD